MGIDEQKKRLEIEARLNADETEIEGVLEGYNEYIDQATKKYENNPIAQSMAELAAKKVAVDTIQKRGQAATFNEYGEIKVALPSREVRAKKYQKQGTKTHSQQNDVESIIGFGVAIVGIVAIIGLVIFVAAEIFNAIDDQSTPHITIENKLVRPVNIYFNGYYQAQINSRQTMKLSVSDFPIQVDFDVVNATTSNGTSIGDQMSGYYSSIEHSTTLTISHIIGDSFFFSPRLNNNTGWDCEISVNDGYTTEARPGILKAYTQNVVIGYYILYSDSNVTLYCDNGTTHWWGINPNLISNNGPETKLSVESESGLITLTLN